MGGVGEGKGKCLFVGGIGGVVVMIFGWSRVKVGREGGLRLIPRMDGADVLHVIHWK